MTSASVALPLKKMGAFCTIVYGAVVSVSTRRANHCSPALPVSVALSVPIVLVADAFRPTASKREPYPPPRLRSDFSRLRRPRSPTLIPIGEEVSLLSPHCLATVSIPSSLHTSDAFSRSSFGIRSLARGRGLPKKFSSPTLSGRPLQSSRPASVAPDRLDLRRPLRTAKSDRSSRIESRSLVSLNGLARGQVQKLRPSDR